MRVPTGMMQTTVVSTMVSHTVGWARVFWALPGREEEPGAFRGHRAGVRAAPQSSPFLFLAAPLSQSQNLSHLWPLFLLPNVYLQIDSSSKLYLRLQICFCFGGVFLAVLHSIQGLSSPTRMESIPLQWKFGVLTTGPGMAPDLFFFNCFNLTLLFISASHS